MSETAGPVLEKKQTSWIHTAHDSAFKVALGDIRVAHDFLRQHLPKELFNRLDRNEVRAVYSTKLV